MRRMVGDQPVKATLVGVGVGSTARQTYPKVSYETIALNLNNIYDMSKISMSGFDFRTDATSLLKGSVPFGGNLAPQGNVAPTFEYRLNDRIFDGATMDIETVITPSPKPLAYPSSLIISGDYTTGRLVGLEFGSNGLRIFSLNSTGIVFQHTIAVGLQTNYILRVSKILSWIQVFVNGTRVGAASHPSFATPGAPGLGTYSNTAPNLSTPIGPTAFMGCTSLSRVKQGRTFFGQVQLEVSTNLELAKMYIKDAGNYVLSIIGARWKQTTVFSGRNWYLKLNGTVVAQYNEQNGLDTVSTNTVAVPANSTLTVEANSNAPNAQDRVPLGGYIQYKAV